MKTIKGFIMIEMSIVLSICFVLMLVADELRAMYTREWGENSKSIF